MCHIVSSMWVVSDPFLIFVSSLALKFIAEVPVHIYIYQAYQLCIHMQLVLREFFAIGLYLLSSYWPVSGFKHIRTPRYASGSRWHGRMRQSYFRLYYYPMIHNEVATRRPWVYAYTTKQPKPHSECPKTCARTQTFNQNRLLSQ